MIRPARKCRKNFSWRQHNPHVLPRPFNNRNIDCCVPVAVLGCCSARIAIQSGNPPPSFSVQHLIDDVPIKLRALTHGDKDKNGVYGSKCRHAFRYIKLHGVLEPAHRPFFPRFAEGSTTCREDNPAPIPTGRPLLFIDRYVDFRTPFELERATQPALFDLHTVPRDGGDRIPKIIREEGPISAEFQMYGTGPTGGRGVYRFTKSDEKNNEELFHAVLITGYGEDPITGVKFYEVQFGAGEDWGDDDGYCRVRRDLFINYSYPINPHIVDPAGLPHPAGPPPPPPAGPVAEPPPPAGPVAEPPPPRPAVVHVYQRRPRRPRPRPTVVHVYQRRH